MKTKITLAMVLITAFIIRSNGQWANVPITETRGLTTVSFSGNNGIIGGDNGLIMHSTDGGLTWSDSIYYSYDPIKTSAFSSPTTAAMGSSGHFYTSSNSGADFTFHSGPSGAGTYQAMAFTSATHGYAIDDYCGVAVTNDGGQSWTQGPKPCSAYPTMNDMSWPTATNGYVCGTNGNVFKTGDGGATWSSITPPSGNIGYFAIQFIDSNIGFISGHSGNGQDTLVFQKTIDGGATWIDLHHNLIAGGVPGLVAIHSFSFINQNLGYLLMSNKIFKTTDGGSNWALDYTSTDDAQYGFNKILATPGLVIAVGAHGVIARLEGANTGMKEMKEVRELTVYPNPSSNNITLGSFLVESKNAFLEITDMAGRIVRAERISSNDVDISQLSQGLYLGKLINNNGSSSTFKFVKQ